MANVTDYSRRVEDTDTGWQIGITTYRLGNEWWCIVDNVSPGARLCSHKAETREAAEAHAIGVAKRLLARTRRAGARAC